MFNLIKNLNKPCESVTSTETGNTTLSSGTSVALGSGNSVAFDSHIGQSIKIATAQIDLILRGEKFSPPEKKNLSMEENSEGISQSDMQEGFTTSTPKNLLGEKEGEDVISQGIGKPPEQMLQFSQGAYKFQGGEGTTFRAPNVIREDRPIRVMKTLKPHLVPKTPKGDTAQSGMLGSQDSQETENMRTGLSGHIGQIGPTLRTEKSGEREKPHWWGRQDHLISGGNEGRFSVNVGRSWMGKMGGGGWRTTPARGVEASAREINWSDWEEKGDNQGGVYLGWGSVDGLERKGGFREEWNNAEYNSGEEVFYTHKKRQKRVEGWEPNNTDRRSPEFGRRSRKNSQFSKASPCSEEIGEKELNRVCCTIIRY